MIGLDAELYNQGGSLNSASVSVAKSSSLRPLRYCRRQYRYILYYLLVPFGASFLDRKDRKGIAKTAKAFS
jgi:hypothetical protein